jgi:hypothetical protein
MNLAPADIWSDVCTFLDTRDLAKFEQCFRHVCTRAAWLRILTTRFQLSLVNRPYLEKSAKPRDCVKRLTVSSDPFCVRSTPEQLTALAAGMLDVPTDEIESAFYALTPTSLEPLESEYTLHRHWLVLRELAQRGLVRAPAFSKPLKRGQDITHIVVRIKEGSACGLDHLKHPHATMHLQRARVEVVCNGVVQFREYAQPAHANDMFSVLSASFGKFGWASRDDMFVLEIK